MSLNTLIPCLSDGINAALSELNAAALNSITEIRLRKNLPLVLCAGKNVYFITLKANSSITAVNMHIELMRKSSMLCSEDSVIIPFTVR